MTKKLILGLVAGSLAFAVTGCNAVKGLGRDIESVGQKGDEIT